MTDEFLTAAALEIIPSGPVIAEFDAPASKSYTNRALLLAALASGESRIRHPLASDDTERMGGALERFGVEIEAVEDGFRVFGCDGRLRAPSEPIDCGLSGTTIRFLTAAAALIDGETVLTGGPPLLRRPIAPLTGALESLGAGVRWLGEPGYPPLAVRGPLKGGRTAINASVSSQFLTALLMAAPYAQGPVTIEVTALAARPYIAMTLAAMSEFGVTPSIPSSLSPEGFPSPPNPFSLKGRGRAVVLTIPVGQGYVGREYEVEYDASSAAHLLALGASTAGVVTVRNARPSTLQADARFSVYLEEMGCEVESDGARLTVRGPDRLRPLSRDLSDTPDMTPPLAVLCAYADGDSHLYNVEFVRGHETDRLSATASELANLGVEVVEERDGLRIAGDVPHGGRIATHHDHRMAMAFAAAGARTPGVLIVDPGCVAKTFPGFWTSLSAAGVAIRKCR